MLPHLPFLPPSLVPTLHHPTHAFSSCSQALTACKLSWPCLDANLNFSSKGRMSCFSFLIVGIHFSAIKCCYKVNTRVSFSELNPTTEQPPQLALIIAKKREVVFIKQLSSPQVSSCGFLLEFWPVGQHPTEWQWPGSSEPATSAHNTPYQHRTYKMLHWLLDTVTTDSLPVRCDLVVQFKAAE